MSNNTTATTRRDTPCGYPEINGAFHIHGSVVGSTCTVDGVSNIDRMIKITSCEPVLQHSPVVPSAALTRSADAQVILLPTIDIQQLQGNVGSFFGVTPVQITLNNDLQAKHAQVIFKGGTAAENSAILPIEPDEHSASGIGIAIFDPSNTPLPLGEPSSMVALQPGKNRLHFSAGYTSINTTPTAGYVRAVLFFNVIFS